MTTVTKDLAALYNIAFSFRIMESGKRSPDMVTGCGCKICIKSIVDTMSLLVILYTMTSLAFI